MSQDVEAIIKESLKLERAQRFLDALNAVTDARRKDPRDRRLAIRQGQLLEITKQFPQALGLYRNLVEAQPETQEADLVIGLARCSLAVGDVDQAARLFAEVQAKLPKHPEVLTGLAGCRRQKALLEEAEALARQALAARPDFKRAIHVLAEIQIDKKEDEAALRTLERNVFREDLHGDSLDLWLSILKRLGRDRYTQQTLTELSARYPNKPEFTFGLGVVAHRAGEIPIARPALEKADRMLPNNARILHELGVLERTAGNIERSQELIGRSLALQPEQPAALRTYGTEHKYRYGDPEFTRLNYAAARLSDIETVDQVHIHYALGKAFEDVDELDTAFRHYEIAGAKKRRLERYDERGAVQMFKLMPQLVNAKTLAQKPQPGCHSDVPVFIVGMPRSGTSLLEQILSSHPDVFGAGELKFLPGVLDNISVGGRPGRTSTTPSLCFLTSRQRLVGGPRAAVRGQAAAARRQALQAHRRQDARQFHAARPDPRRAAERAHHPQPPASGRDLPVELPHPLRRRAVLVVQPARAGPLLQAVLAPHEALARAVSGSDARSPLRGQRRRMSRGRRGA